MRVCILGGRGMLGHKLYEALKPVFGDVKLTVRGEAGSAPEVVRRYGSLPLICDFDAMSPEYCARLLRELRPDVVLNCIGALKQSAAGSDPVAAIAVNGLFPHYVARAVAEWGGRLIHFSTDCVFSGSKGNYSEQEAPDATDLYGRSKLIGEPCGARVLTVRTSMIGPELAHKHSLLEWFLGEAREGRVVKGYRRAIFSGLTTQRLARMVTGWIQDLPELAGTYHVAGEAINKYDLLCALREAYGLDVKIVADDGLVIDRSLNSAKFRAATGTETPRWGEMIAEMVEGVAV